MNGLPSYTWNNSVASLRLGPDSTPAAPKLKCLVVMEDLRAGSGSPYEAAEGSDPEIAERAILDYARALGRLHGSTAGRSNRFRELRADLPLVAKRRPLYHDPWSDSSSYTVEAIKRAIVEYKAVLSELGVRPAPGFEDEIEQVTHSVEEDEGDFLVLCQGDQNSLQHWSSFVPRQIRKSPSEAPANPLAAGNTRDPLLSGVPAGYRAMTDF